MSKDTDSISSEKSGNEDEYWMKVMNVCDQNNPIPFGLEYPSWTFTKLERLDCGTYSQVMRGYNTTSEEVVVFKVINVVSVKTLKKLKGISLSGTELLKDVYNEIVISRALSDLHLTICSNSGHEYQTHNYPKMFSAKLVHGNIPNYFMLKPTNDNMDKLEKIELFRENRNTPREYLVLCLKYCGVSLWQMINEKRVNAYQLLSISYQLIFSLTVAEIVYEFEHRDLHIANVLLKKTMKTHLEYKIKTIVHKVKTFGIKAFIIDTTFSRIKIGGNVYSTSLKERLKPKANVKNPDLQEFTYQQMYYKAGDDWDKWIPETNILWMKYYFKLIISCNIVKHSKDQKPLNQMNAMYEQISKYTKLEDFIATID